MKKCLLLFCFAFLLFNAFAQVNVTWTGANGANWSLPSNWSTGAVPTAVDTVILNSNNNCNVDINPTIAAIRAIGSGNSNGLSNNTGSAKTITISSNPASSPVLYVQAGSNMILANGPTSSAVSITTYGASGTNTALVDGTMFISITSTWNVANGSAVTNVYVSSTGTIYVPGPHIGANVFLNSTIANLRFLSGSNLGWGRNGGAIPAADYQNGSTITISGVTSTMPSLSNAANYNGLLIWNSGGQTISGASAVLLPTPSYSMDSIRVTTTGTGTLRITTTPASYTLGHVEVQGGTLEMSSAVAGGGAGTILTDLKISGGTVYGNATYGGDVGGTPMSLTINGNLIVSGGTLNLTNRHFVIAAVGTCDIYVLGDVSQTAGSITATTNFPGVTYISLKGTVAQNLTMSTFSGPMGLVIDNSSAAGVTLLSNLTIPASPAFFKLTNGVLTTTAAHLLTMAAGSTVSGASNSSFVDGPVAKIGNTAFTFPVGKTTCGPSHNKKGYVALGIANFTGGTVADQYTAEYVRGNASVLGNGTITATGLNHVSLCDYWTLTRDAGGSKVDITVAFDDSINNCVTTSPYIDNFLSLVIAHNSNSNIITDSWDAYGVAGTHTGTTVTGTITWNGVQSSTFGAFALASMDVYNPLPINLNYLNGLKQGNNNYLNWKVTCTNNPTATMVLERSADGNNFTEPVTSITADALRCQQPFDYTDAHPWSGINYYRLKMIDANGKITYSSKVALLNKATGFEIVGLYPNIVSSNAILNVTAAQASKMDVLVTDVAGRQVQKIGYNVIAGSNQFTLNLANLSAGTYQITGYTAEGISKTIRFVKQ